LSDSKFTLKWRFYAETGLLRNLNKSLERPQTNILMTKLMHSWKANTKRNIFGMFHNFETRVPKVKQKLTKYFHR